MTNFFEEYFYAIIIAVIVIIIFIVVIVQNCSDSTNNTRYTRPESPAIVITDTYYHYTDKEGLDAILYDQVIKQSQQRSRRGDAVFGDGVYLTKLRPTDGKIQIAANNWDGAASNILGYVTRGRVDHYIELDLHPSSVEECTNERDVYKYPGDLFLTRGMNASHGVVSSAKH